LTGVAQKKVGSITLPTTFNRSIDKLVV
jgi:hypothetical protein